MANPQETPEAAAKRIFGKRAAYYVSSTTHTDPEVLARVAELAGPDAEAIALDIGTGTGHTAFALSPHVARVIGLDLTPEMLVEAEKLRAERSLSNVEFRTGDVRALPFEAGEFPRVTCRRAAHHFSDIHQALSEIRRVMSPGGRLVVDDRSVPEDDFVDACMNELDFYHDESHIREYRPSEWQTMLHQAGFEVEVVEPYIQHRPLTSLTDGVSEENVRKIHARFAGLKAEERKKLNYVEEGIEIFTNHWYITVAAVAR